MAQHGGRLALLFKEIASMQHRRTAAWHDADGPHANGDAECGQDPAGAAWAARIGALAERQHRANFDLWHEEDDARDRQASDRQIASVKHRIDHLNQQRNDLVEQMDDLLLQIAGGQTEGAPLHSETPGMIVDRLSILSLKIFHTAIEAERASASDEHRATNLERLGILQTQHSELTGCLEELWRDVVDGKRRFKLYRQMKMYNDPALNPVLYKGEGNAGNGEF